MKEGTESHFGISSKLVAMSVKQANLSKNVKINQKIDFHFSLSGDLILRVVLPSCSSYLFSKITEISVILAITLWESLSKLLSIEESESHSRNRSSSYSLNDSYRSENGALLYHG